MHNERTKQRILAICELVDIDNNLIGYTLDLTLEGIRIIVPNSFDQNPEFNLFIRPKENNPKNDKIKVKIKTIWRESKNEEFDEIGGKIIKAEKLEDLKSLLEYCETSNEEQDSLDVYL